MDAPRPSSCRFGFWCARETHLSTPVRPDVAEEGPVVDSQVERVHDGQVAEGLRESDHLDRFTHRIVLSGLMVRQPRVVAAGRIDGLNESLEIVNSDCQRRMILEANDAVDLLVEVHAHPAVGGRAEGESVVGERQTHADSFPPLVIMGDMGLGHVRDRRFQSRAPKGRGEQVGGDHHAIDAITGAKRPPQPDVFMVESIRKEHAITCY